MERINELSEPHSELCKIPSYLKNKRRSETSKNIELYCLQYCKKIYNTTVYNSLIQEFLRFKILNFS